MGIKILQYNSIADIRKRFTSRFPFLKLEFFRPSAHADVLFTKSNMITAHHLTLSEIGSVSNGELYINDCQKISELEENFMEFFGVPVQVFRKSGDIWLETSGTDHMTLTALNSKAEEESIPRAAAEAEIPDIHEQE